MKNKYLIICHLTINNITQVLPAFEIEATSEFHAAAVVDDMFLLIRKQTNGIIRGEVHHPELRWPLPFEWRW